MKEFFDESKEIMSKMPITVQKEVTIRALIKILLKNQISGVPVVDKEGKLEGIVSEKDVIRAIAELIRVNLSIDEIKENTGRYNWVEGIMSRDVITVTEESDALEVFRIMAKRRIHRIPIVADEKLVGIISSSDAYRLLEKMQKTDKAQ